MGFDDRLRLIATNTIERPSLGKQIKTARLNADVEQGELAEAIGVARQTLGQWESGRAVPPRGMVIAIALLTGANFEEMDEALAEAWRRRSHNGLPRRSRRPRVAANGGPVTDLPLEEADDTGSTERNGESSRSTRCLIGNVIQYRRSTDAKPGPRLSPIFPRPIDLPLPENVRPLGRLAPRPA